ncbi:hypothetical protein R3P38DRAFT_3059181 [Favolaschia claudopus]|uniref:Uncharacterized protein n=1 Tax=Favolaschia claudopus TaxID=2862362 RepID=A0AAW0A360_9AGAR
MTVQHYQFGETTKLSKEAFQATIRNIIMTVRTWGPLFLVFHNPREDIKLQCDLDHFPYSELNSRGIADISIWACSPRLSAGAPLLSLRFHEVDIRQYRICLILRILAESVTKTQG